MKKPYAIIAVVIAMLSFFSFTVFAQYEGLNPGEHYDSDLINDNQQAPQESQQQEPVPPEDYNQPMPERDIASVPPEQEQPEKPKARKKKRIGNFEEIENSTSDGDFQRVH